MSPKKVLVVLTNVSKYQTADKPTGLWLSEASHFVKKIEEAGLDIDYVSPKGGYIPIDPNSLGMADSIDWEYYQNSDFMSKLGKTLKPSEVNAADYSAIYYTGGHGTCWDFADSKELQEISWKIYENNGVVSSVCHGAIGLLNIKDDKGEYLIKDKKVTGFSDSEEKEVQLDKLVPFSTEQELKKRGAIYEQAANWKEFAISDGRIVTGQNPASGAAVASKVLAIINKN